MKPKESLPTAKILGEPETMLKYTICFIRQGTKILMLNRDFPSWMGVWNGVGGKLEEGESAKECIIREVYEETGLLITAPQFKGIVSWMVDGACADGMYLYLAELPVDEVYPTPIKTVEGILDWKEYDWLMHPQNVGLTSDISKYLRYVLLEEGIYEHRCFYQNGKLVDHAVMEMDQDYEGLRSSR